MYFGVFTATEAAAAGALGALLIAMFVYRNFGLADLWHSAIDAARNSAMLFLILAAAALLGNVLTKLRIPNQMVDLVTQYGVSQVGFLLAVMALVFVLGMFLETISIILITTPVVLPVLAALKIDPVWYGILLTINLELALITPPVGMNLFAIKAITRAASARSSPASPPMSVAGPRPGAGAVRSVDRALAAGDDELQVTAARLSRSGLSDGHRPLRRRLLHARLALDDKYALDSGRVFLTGTQALVRLLILQRQRDLAAGRNTAGFVSGYRGSPLGGLDQSLWKAQPFLDRAHIRFQPGLNEDLAATSIWGTQQVNLYPGARYDGVFAMWYGKGPGVDRCGDVFKHANHAGTSKHGGVLVLAGDDHGAKSSTLPHQSDHMFSAAMIPVLYPRRACAAPCGRRPPLGTGRARA